ncbi:MOSC domain-containing protein [Halomonas faecis]|uniref:MOSC domain-containing protein n=1 Tax=Halomonas faecis TaxID=1562110 RepID=UPI0013D631A2|nr:MOSC N-terminal beta barrel domain-containing protein [Halomonas faecis]
MHISELNIYPVKSLRGIALEQAELGVRGLAFDRHWMIVDDVGRFVTQRQLPAMAQVSVHLTAERLELHHTDAATLRIELARDDQPSLTAYVWEDRCRALDEGAEAARWLTDVLGDVKGSGLRLVRFPLEEQRAVDARYQRGEGAHTAFADGFPFLITNDASLAAVNATLAQKGLDPVPMSRFRPNVVVAEAEAFAENGWDALHGAGERFRLGLRKACQRCKITTVDQLSGEIRVPGEPLRTLVEMSAHFGKPGGYFGQNATLLAGAGETLRVGESLTASD